MHTKTVVRVRNAINIRLNAYATNTCAHNNKLISFLLTSYENKDLGTNQPKVVYETSISKNRLDSVETSCWKGALKRFLTMKNLAIAFLVFCAFICSGKVET